MSASVDIQTKRIANIVSVPIQSVTTRSDSSDAPQNEVKKADQNNEGVVVTNEKDKKFENKDASTELEECVFILSEGKAKKVKVKTGIQDNDYIQIIEGIKDGDEVISGPYAAISKQLKEGTAVKKVDKSKLFTLPKK